MITGTTGFIGSHLAEELTRKKVSLNLFIRRRTPFIVSQEKEGAKVFLAEPGNYEVLKASIQDVDTIIHCAAATKALKKEDYFKANVEFTKNILTLLNKKQKFVFISSQAAAGPSNSSEPVNENNLPNPLTYYGESKLMAEDLVREWGKKNNNNYIILRPSVVYGPREKDFYNFIRLIKIGLLVLFGNEKKRISIVHIDDLVSAIVTATERSSVGETYFVSNDESYTWEDIGCAIKKALNKSSLLKIKLPEFTAYPIAYFFELISLITKKPALINSQKIIEMKQSAWLCSNNKIKDMLNWKPRLSLEEGMNQTATWYTKENWI